MINCLNKLNYDVVFVSSVHSLSRIQKGTILYVFAVGSYFRHSQIHLAYSRTTGCDITERIKGRKTLHCI